MSDHQNQMPDFSVSGPVEYNPSGAEAENILANAEAGLLAIHGVVSVGIGRGTSGGEALVVGVLDAGVAASLPSEVGGVPVVVNITGEVDALPKP